MQFELSNSRIPARPYVPDRAPGAGGLLTGDILPETKRRKKSNNMP